MASVASEGSVTPSPAGAAVNAIKDVAALPTRNTIFVVFGIMMASLLQILDTTIANVAIPHMQASLGATPDEISWVLTSYIVASAVAMPMTGWLADRVGSRRLFILSTGAFVIASMLCGTAQNITEMVLFRALQGAAGAFIAPLSQSAMLDISKPSRQSQMMAIWGMGIMIGPILGPIIGGTLTENWNWRWVFYVNLPLGAIALFILITGLPSRAVKRRRFDMFGFAMIAIAITSLQLMLDRGNHVDWFDSLEIWIYAAALASAVWVGAIHFITTTQPTLFNPALFANRNFVIALFFMIALGIIMFATMALLPPMLQRLFGYSVVDTGWALMPRGVGTLISMQLSSILLRMGFDPRKMVMTGFLLAMLSFWQMSGWSLEMSSSYVVISGFIQGMGMGLCFIPLNSVAFATLPPALRTEGSSLLNLFRSLGASVGISVTTALLGRNLQQSHSDLSAHVTASVTDLVDFSTIDRFQNLGTTAMSMVDAQVNRQAAMIAYIDNFYLMMWLSLAAIPLALLLRRVRSASASKVDLPH